jgi:hypothetical protein
MPLNRTYIIGRDDHFWGAENVEYADDQDAIRKVQQTMDGRCRGLGAAPLYRAAVVKSWSQNKPPYLAPRMRGAAGCGHSSFAAQVVLRANRLLRSSMRLYLLRKWLRLAVLFYKRIDTNRATWDGKKDRFVGSCLTA